MLNRESTDLLRQQGGTLLGLVVGLLIGLGIAVAVALVINKGSTPFTSKTVKADKSADHPAGLLSDPNKPMYGSKEAVKEAARGLSVEVEGKGGGAQAQNGKAPEPRLAAPDDTKGAVRGATGNRISLENAPAHEKSIAKAGTAKEMPPKADGREESWTYYLQAGAFREQADAENIRAKLALLGVDATMTDRLSDNGILYRVRIGPFKQVEVMNRVRDKLLENGVDVAVVRNQK